MDKTALFQQLKANFPGTQIEADFPLAPLTTLKIGGPADIFIQTQTTAELVNILKYLKSAAATNFSAHSDSESASPQVASTAKISLPGTIPLTMLGNGSNVLIADSGLRGIVIRHLSKEIVIGDSASPIAPPPLSAAVHPEADPQKYLDFAALDYDESDAPGVTVTLDAGVPLPYAINYLISQGITGLQWFAYIPGTIGGATWYNIHGGKYNLSTYIDSVKYYDLKTGETTNLVLNGAGNDFSEHSDRDPPAGGEPAGSEHRKNSFTSHSQFKYESSPFQSHPDWIILSTTFHLYRGDAARAKAAAAAWIAQKAKVQPMNSAGSVFQNPSPTDATRLWGEPKSAGWIIDHELGWKGKSVGGAQISLQHANFIVNNGHATAADYYRLVREIQAAVKSRFNLDLHPEVNLLGDFG